MRPASLDRGRNLKTINDMKKTLFSIALMALAAIPSFAQSQNCKNVQNCQQTVCNGPQNCNNDSCDKKICSFDRSAALFEGINLSNSQRERIDALNAKVRAERDQARADFQKGKAEAKKAAQEMSADERKAAKMASKEAKKDAKKARMEARKAGKTAYLAEMKTILTADQYVKYLENAYTNAGKQVKAKFTQARKGDKHKGGKKDFARKGDRRDDRRK